MVGFGDPLQIAGGKDQHQCAVGRLLSGKQPRKKHRVLDHDTKG